MADGDVAVSVCVLVAVVLLCEATRALLRRSARSAVHAEEFVSTLQLCCCAHELRLLAEGGRAEPRLSLALTYLACTAHGLTFGGALGNACSVLERACGKRLACACALRRIACQLAAACAARALLPRVWALGLSDLHVRHERLGFQCVSQIRAPLAHAAAVEFAGAFCVQSAISRTHALEEKYRVHAIAAVTTALVYAGGGVSGSVFNPSLSVSTQLLCSGNSVLDYSLVYWAGPLLGTLASVLAFGTVVPTLWPTSDPAPHPPHPPPETKKRN
ncbi:unnamed protein product [Merluccius merluccius]